MWYRCIFCATCVEFSATARKRKFTVRMLCFGCLNHNFCMTISTTDSADGAPDRYCAFIKIPHCRPQTSPIRNPSSICRSIPILRVVGSDKRNSLRESCSVRVKGCGSGFCVCGSLTHISMGGMRCRCAAYLQIRRSIPRHSCAEDAPSGL